MNNTGGVAVQWQLQQQRRLQQIQGQPDMTHAAVNFPFTQHTNGLQNHPSLQVHPMYSRQPIHWQQAQFTQLQWRQRMMQWAQEMNLQQQKELALQSQQTQLQQLRHNHMLKSIFMHHINRPLSSYQARSIVEIEPLGWSMNKLTLPGLPYPPTFIETFHLLPVSYQHALCLVSVFKFSTRKATPEEYHSGLEYTPESAFFLQSLKSQNRFREHHMLLGFRCQCCLKYRDGTYVKGSTSFVDMGVGRPDASIRDALEMRIRHLVACPCVDDQNKNRFKRFLEFTDAREKKNQEMFVALWTQTVLSAHFPATFPTKFLTDISQDTVPWYGGDVTYFAEAVVSSDLFDALSFASQLIRDGRYTFDDMGETMQEGGFPSSLFLELLSEICVLQVTISHETHLPNATLHCAKCKDHGHLSLPNLISKSPLRKTLHTDVRDFVLSHAQSCPSIPFANKQVFKRLGDSLDNSFWYKFCTWWQTFLTRLLRGCLPLNLPKPTYHCDHFRYITLADKRNQHYSRLPLLTLPNPDPPDSPTMDDDTRHPFIVLHNDRYQDCDGNRWFRCQISKHRPLYLQMSESVQEGMKKSILNFISKSGYSFVVVSSEGIMDPAPPDMVEKYVTNSLLNGFPEVMVPQIASNGDSKAFDVDIAPMVGIFYENIRWDYQKDSKKEFTFPILKKDKVEATSLQWGDVWPSSPEELLHAIRLVNEDPNDRNPAIQSAVPTTDNAASAPSTTPDLVSHSDNITTAGTDHRTSCDDVHMNDVRRIRQDVTTLTESDLELYKRNQSAIAPCQMQEPDFSNTSKRARTS